MLMRDQSAKDSKDSDLKTKRDDSKQHLQPDKHQSNTKRFLVTTDIRKAEQVCNREPSNCVLY